MKKQKLLTVLLLFALILVSLSIRAAAEERPSKILILPFTIHSDKELSFLKDSVHDMLSTRLTIKGRCEPMNRGAADRSVEASEGVSDLNQAVSIGEKLSADYVVFGSLTVFGESISTDARLVDVKKKAPAVVFSKTGEKRGDLIFHVGLFADKIEEEIFKQQKPSAPRAKTPAPFSKYFFSDWKSRKFDTAIRGLAIGDVDGDGSNETVFIDKSSVFVYRYMDRRFKKIGEAGGDDSLRYLGVDVADVNKNNKAEIFVTTLSPNSNRPSSFVLEWDGSGFAIIDKEINMFLRVLKGSEKTGPILIGQEKAHFRGVFSKNGVHKIEWISDSDGGSYESATRITLPKNANIFGFTKGDVLNDGADQIVSFDRSSRIRISNTSGSDMWHSDNKYGGSDLHIDIPDQSGSKGDFERMYLHPRIHIADIDYDGKNEVIAVANDDFANNIMARMRSYTSGRIDSMSWNNESLQNEWTTGKITGYISDYIVEDINGDGGDELVFSVVVKGEGVFGGKKSYITARAISN
ncbi:MAG: VCBS repeat-containing protein [Deltaproteobacteria bacterium]|nr:VCBS repeat-containing protein [Deltaproteobacteria bacterium]